MRGIAVLVALAALAPPALADPKPLKPNEGVLLFTYQPPPNQANKLAVFTFAPAAGEQLVDRGKTVKHTPQTKEWPLSAVKLAPGRYVLREVFIYNGANPNFCFGPGTVAFEIKPGEATYAGVVSLAPPPAPGGGFVGHLIGGNGGAWSGKLTLLPGDRAAAQAALAKMYAAPLSEAGGLAATFATEGRPKSEIGDTCAKAKPAP